MGKNTRTIRRRKGGRWPFSNPLTNATPGQGDTRRRGWFASPEYVTKDVLAATFENLRIDLEKTLNEKINLKDGFNPNDLDAQKTPPLHDVEVSRKEIVDAILQKIRGIESKMTAQPQGTSQYSSSAVPESNLEEQKDEAYFAKRFPNVTSGHEQQDFEKPFNFKELKH